MNCPDSVAVRRGRFRWLKVGGAGADGGRAMNDFCHADSGNVTTAVADFKDGRGMGDFRDDVAFEASPRIVVGDHVRAAVLVQEWADEGRHVDDLFVPLEDVSGGIVMKRMLHDVGRGFGCNSEGGHSYGGWTDVGNRCRGKTCWGWEETSREGE
jgi:hypothetical protein